MPTLFNANNNAMDCFCINPTLASFRRLKKELDIQGLTVEQAFPDLADFLTWKGKGHLYKHIFRLLKSGA